MSDNKPEPVVEECDKEAARKHCAGFAGGEWALQRILAAHRTAAVARREAEIVCKIDEALIVLKSQQDSMHGQDYDAMQEAIEALEKIQNGGGA